MNIRRIRLRQSAMQGQRAVRIRGLCVNTGRWLKPEMDKPVRARFWRYTAPHLSGAATVDAIQFSSWGANEDGATDQPPARWIAYDFGRSSMREIVEIPLPQEND